jgi:apolipoprotein N-acyltransferase
VVDPVGRVIAHTDTFRQQAISAPIHWMRQHTVYERVGDWPWVIVSAGMIFAAFRRREQPAGRLEQAPAAES